MLIIWGYAIGKHGASLANFEAYPLWPSLRINQAGSLEQLPDINKYCRA